MNLANRLVYLQSWWVASEFLRRHPEFDLVETHPGGGLYDCLAILGPRGATGPTHIDLNRKGRIHIHSGISPNFDANSWELELPVEWSSEAKQRNRRQLPLFLEAAVGLSAPQQTPVTTPKTLIYRVIYQLLLFALNEVEDWEAHNAQYDSSGMDSGWDPDYFAQIPSARSALENDPNLDNRQTCFWAVLRGGRCLALLQENGMLHRPDALPMSVMTIYDAEHRDILSASLKVRQLITAQQ
ncbi:TY-Chap2 family putative peptide chaperone [Brevibacterium casei]|uniref:TY-Chap2 family putative peptide chaperone n=1 Tax=Brevibacterium casei TaxID=33889 RepID=UPI003EED8630